jgi:hypothetical protein
MSHLAALDCKDALLQQLPAGPASLGLRTTGYAELSSCESTSELDRSVRSTGNPLQRDWDAGSVDPGI